MLPPCDGVCNIADPAGAQRRIVDSCGLHVLQAPMSLICDGASLCSVVRIEEPLAGTERTPSALPLDGAVGMLGSKGSEATTSDAFGPMATQRMNTLPSPCLWGSTLAPSACVAGLRRRNGLPATARRPSAHADSLGDELRRLKSRTCLRSAGHVGSGHTNGLPSGHSSVGHRACVDNGAVGRSDVRNRSRRWRNQRRSEPPCRDRVSGRKCRRVIGRGQRRCS